MFALATLLDINLHNDTLYALAALAIIAVCIVWLLGHHPWHH